MREKMRNFFLSLLTQDMAKQARQVEVLTILIFFLMLGVVWSLWQYKIELTAFSEGQRVVIGKLNIFELLLSRK